MSLTDGGDILTPDEVRELLHVGVKGMKWGVRKTPEQRAASKKDRQEKRAIKKADRDKFKLETKLSGGEVVASALIAGPIGVLGYKAIKRRAASKKLENKDLSAEEQTDAARKLGIGEAVAVAVVTSPVGLITYAAAKTAAAHQVKEF